MQEAWAQDCRLPTEEAPSCCLCGDIKHKKAQCPYKRPPKVEVEVTTEVTREVQELGEMTLLDRIALLDHPEWTPDHCAKCGNQNPRHVELECPSYEYCNWCRSLGSYGFINRHRCASWNEDTVSTGWADYDADLYHTDDGPVDF